MSEQKPPQNHEQNSSYAEQETLHTEASFVVRGIAVAVDKFRESRVKSLDSEISRIEEGREALASSPDVNQNSAKAVLGQNNDPALRPVLISERRVAAQSERKLRKNMRIAGVNRDLHSTYDLAAGPIEIPDSQPEMGKKNEKTRALVDERLRRLEQRRKWKAESEGETYVPLGQVEGDPYVTETKIVLGSPKHTEHFNQRRLRKSERRRLNKAIRKSERFTNKIERRVASIRAVADGTDTSAKAVELKDKRLVGKIEDRSEKKQRHVDAIQGQESLKKLGEFEAKLKKKIKGKPKQ